MADEFPPSSQWVWYATRELKSQLAREGLTCPKCQTSTQNIDLHEEGSIPLFLCSECGASSSAEEFHLAKRYCSREGASTLYRPIGELELEKVRLTDFTRFPPRLVWQPIFYPVLTEEYADFIAREWNSTDPDHDFVGYVTRFDVRNDYLSQHQIHTASDRKTLEYWIPAEELELFNDNIISLIEVVGEFRRGQRV